jgi:hypothetical protein
MRRNYFSSKVLQPRNIKASRHYKNITHSFCQSTKKDRLALENQGFRRSQPHYKNRRTEAVEFEHYYDIFFDSRGHGKAPAPHA